ncbi:MAG: response regulator [Ktedonobacterales bacterium]
MQQVLIADDSATVRLMLRGWLEGAGYEVREAADGAQALEHIRSSTDIDPLVVLLDYGMPKLSGYEVLQHAAAEGLLPPRCSYVVISALTSNFPPDFSALLRQLSIQILPKPFDEDTLLYVTNFVTQRSQQHPAVKPPASTASAEHPIPSSGED